VSDSSGMTNSSAFSDVSAATRELAHRLAPSIVSIQGRPRHPATAFVVGAERLLTTSHSVEWDEHVRVRVPDGSTLAATVVGRDQATDLVVLSAPGLAVGPVVWADETPDTGTLGLVLGRGWGGHLIARLVALTRLDGPIRLGRGRTVGQLLGLGLTPYTGFSGSAVVTADGRVAGISTTGLLRGAGLAVPSALARTTVEVLARDGRIRRGFLGVSTQPVTLPPTQRPAGGPEAGLLVVDVGADSPASAAGLLVGDIVTSFDGVHVSDPEQLLSALTADRIGRDVPVAVIRGRDAQTLTVRVGERPAA
jgi:S1-C subfamily serine protease